MRRITIPPSLSINEARRLNICRICRGNAIPREMADGTVDPFELRRGSEFAHALCLERELEARALKKGETNDEVE